MCECIVIFATAWGTQHGGINSFNYDLCQALAGHKDNELNIVCIIEDTKLQREIVDSTFKKTGIHLIPIPSCEDPYLDQKNISAILSFHRIQPDGLLGHDVYTGQRALNFGKEHGLTTAVIHHMNYRRYKPNAQDRIHRQETILKGADIVFAVGPTLKDSAITILGRQNEGKVKQIQPGITLHQEISEGCPPNFSAITLGRVNLESDLVKQIKLTVASFGRAVQEEKYKIQEKQPSLTIIGLSDDDVKLGNDRDSLQAIGDHYAGNLNTTISAWPYTKNRDDLIEELKSKTVCMVLSWYEGFSLVGLEAISLGIPLILSKETGLYKAIDEQLGGKGTGCLRPVIVSGSTPITAEDSPYHQDTEPVVAALEHIANNLESVKKDAKDLREQLKDVWTWENTAGSILAELRAELPDSEPGDWELLKIAHREFRSIAVPHDGVSVGTLIHIRKNTDHSFEPVENLSRNYHCFKAVSERFASFDPKDSEASDSQQVLDEIREAIDIVKCELMKRTSQNDACQYARQLDFVSHEIGELKTITRQVYHRGGSALNSPTRKHLRQSLQRVGAGMRQLADDIGNLINENLSENNT